MNDTDNYLGAKLPLFSETPEEKCIKMLKSFITSVENSNPNFTYDWNKEVDQLKGKKVGLVFGLEEYQNDKGETKTATKKVEAKEEKIDTFFGDDK